MDQLTSENAASFSNREGGPDAGLDPMPHTFVGRTPASAAGPLAGHSDFVETSTSRARAPGAGQGTRPTNSMRKWEKYAAFHQVGVARNDYRRANFGFHRTWQHADHHITGFHLILLPLRPQTA